MPASQHSEPKYMRMKRSRWGRRVIASRKIALSDFFRNGMSSRRKMKWRTLLRFSSTELALSPQIGLLLTIDGTSGTVVTSPGTVFHSRRSLNQRVNS